MKKSKVYQFIILILLVAIAVKLLPSNAQVNNSVNNDSNEELKLNRLTINLSVKSLDEIKVREGEKILKNQIIATNIREKELLINQFKQLEINYNLLSQPTIRPPEPPEPTYSQELAMIQSAEANLSYWKAIPTPEFKYHDEYVPEFETERLIQAQQIAEKRNNAQFTLNTAIANLQNAKSNYQRELYNHQLRMMNIDREDRQKLTQAISIREKMNDIQSLINELDSISPYTGTIRRIKANQNDNLFNVTIELVNE